MIRRRPMGSIHVPADSASRGTEGVEFIQFVDGQEPQIHEILCLGTNGVTCEVHPTAQIDVGAKTIGQFTTQYLPENGCRIPVIGQICINGSVKILGIHADAWGYGLLFIENVQDPLRPQAGDTVVQTIRNGELPQGALQKRYIHLG